MIPLRLCSLSETNHPESRAAHRDPGQENGPDALTGGIAHRALFERIAGAGGQSIAIRMAERRATLPVPAAMKYSDPVTQIPPATASAQDSDLDLESPRLQVLDQGRAELARYAAMF